MSIFKSYWLDCILFGWQLKPRLLKTSAYHLFGADFSTKNRPVGSPRTALALVFRRKFESLSTTLNSSQLLRSKPIPIYLFIIDATRTASSSVSYFSRRTLTKDHSMNLRMLRLLQVVAPFWGSKLQHLGASHFRRRCYRQQKRTGVMFLKPVGTCHKYLDLRQIFMSITDFGDASKSLGGIINSRADTPD